MRNWLKKLTYILLAIALVAVSVNLFLGPHTIAAGGLTGLAIILERLLQLDRSVTVLVGNAIVILLTLLFLGREVFLNTVIGAGTLPIFIHLVPQRMLVTDPMLSMVAGSVLFGIGVSILYANRASSGGTAVPPLIFQKYWGLNPSIGLFLSDGFVVSFSLLVFSVDSFFYAVFSILITSITMTYIESGMNKKKMVYIFSEQDEAITADILTKIGRGVTLIPVIGAYERTQKQMLLVTLDGKDYRALLTIVNSHDPKAFLITDTVTDVHGKGFTYESGSV
ncbi:MAG: YitT family protein [Oscillospiraceae bacterium]|nr:YitT family protein [Oscillospiraceae bacterium]